MLRQDPIKLQRIVYKVLVLIILLALCVDCLSQQKSIRLPFRTANNLIILSARINGSDTLNFIFDTGLKNSIICELSAGETLDLQEAREIRVMGLGAGTPVEAIHSAGNLLEFGGFNSPDQDFVVLSDNILQLSQKMGTRIHGMLSMQAFYEYIVEIDYEHRYISLSSPGSFELINPMTFASLPLQMESGKPFLIITLTNDNGTSFPVKLLLDSGASNAMWLDMNSLDGFSVPENSRRCYLGCGISGDVQGLRSRIRQVDIGPFSLHDVLVSFPDSIAIAQQEPVPGRNGSLGSEMLKRFDIILNFPGCMIHLRPNSAFPQKFQYDMSGMEVISEVPDRPVYVISRVREGSTAYNAGARAGDRILSINDLPVSECSLDDIYRNFLGEEGKKVRMVILRGEEKLKISFELEEYI